MAFFVIFQVIRCILEGEVGEQSLRAASASQFEQVVVGFAGVEVDTFFYTEDLDGEDGCFAVTQTSFCYQQDIFHDHAAFCGCIHTIVDGGEGCLCTCTGMHGVQVMQQGFHCLVCGFVCFFCCFFCGECLCFCEDIFGYACFQHQFLFCIIVCRSLVQIGIQTLFCQSFIDFSCFFCVFGAIHDFDQGCQVGTVAFDVCFCYTGSQAVVKVTDGLTAVLVILVGLDGDTSQRSVGSDIVGFAQYAVACGETAFEQFQKIQLAACGCQCVEIQIVDVDITVSVGIGMLGIQHIAFVEVLCTFRTVFQHGTHSSVAVDIGIFTFDVTVCCIFICDVLESFHQTVIHVSDSGTFCAVQDIRFCCTHIAVVDQYTFNAVLDLFNGRGFDPFFFKSVGNFMGKA